MGAFGTSGSRTLGALPYAERMKRKKRRQGDTVTLQNPGRNQGPPTQQIQRPTMQQFMQRNPNAKMSRTASPTSINPNAGPGGYRAGPVSSPGTPQGLLEMWQSGHDQAKSANENRYQEILGNLTSTRDRNMALLNGVGEQQGKDLRDDYRKLETRGGQNLISAGLGNTTAVGNMKSGVLREQKDAENRLQAGLNRERIGYDERFNTAIAGFQERRTDSYPDLGTFANAMSQLGNYYGGPRGGSGGGGGGSFVTNTQGTIKEGSGRSKRAKAGKRGGLLKTNWGKTNSKNRPATGAAGSVGHVGPVGSAQPTPGAQGGRTIPKKTDFWSMQKRKNTRGPRAGAASGPPSIGSGTIKAGGKTMSFGARKKKRKTTY
jgi:hypothetical protein